MSWMFGKQEDRRSGLRSIRQFKRILVSDTTTTKRNEDKAIIERSIWPIEIMSGGMSSAEGIKSLQAAAK